MTSVMFAGRGPARKSRNVIFNLSAVAAFVVLALPASAQNIIVTGVSSAPRAAQAAAQTFVAAPVAPAPPRSITTPYVAAAPRERAPMELLIREPQPGAAALQGSPPTITVSTLSFPLNR